MEKGKGKMEKGKWKMEKGKWKVKKGQLTNGKITIPGLSHFATGIPYFMNFQSKFV